MFNGQEMRNLFLCQTGKNGSNSSKKNEKNHFSLQGTAGMHMYSVKLNPVSFKSLKPLSLFMKWKKHKKMKAFTRNN